MDLTNATFAGLITLGVVNVLSFYKPDMDSKLKFTIAVLTAFVLSFVPPTIGNVILDKAKLAIEIAFASSGAYKIAQKAGGAGKY